MTNQNQAHLANDEQAAALPGSPETTDLKKPKKRSKSKSKKKKKPIKAIASEEDPVGKHADELEFLEKGIVEPTSPAVRLVTDERALSWSLNAIRFAVFADMATATILDPNYAFMALPGSHPDSFPDTEPFGVTAATYFLAMTALLGTAISSTFIGSLSDRIGRKPCVAVCLGIGAIGAIANYLARKSFWGFCVTNFCQGLFAGSLPVAMAYVSDVKTTRKEKDDEIGILVALSMLGATGGGIAAILMEDQGLFSPLFVGAAMNLVAFACVVFYVIEPNKMLFVDSHPKLGNADEEEEEAPENMDKKLLINIIVGALFDNIGSSGLFPLAMAPLAFTEFYVNFVAAGQEPIMSQVAFKWLSVMLALAVIPGAGLSQVVFDRIGPAGGCIAGNSITGIVTIAVLFIASIDPVTSGTYASFITVLYIGFPFTVLSQLSTGPMLDAIAPINQRGYVQGLNIAVMNFATAISPYLLGELSDNVGIKEAMWTCICVSFAAALINIPLTRSPVLRRKKKIPKYSRHLYGEDADFVKLAMEGEWVPLKELEELNEERMKKGEPLLVVPYKKYEEDKTNLPLLQRQAYDDFQYLKNRTVEYLNDLETLEKKKEIIEQLYHSRPPQKEQDALARALSQWFTDYLVDAGYFMEDSPHLYKQMIMAAFPPLSDGGELTPDNIEQFGINYIRVLNKYLADNEVTGAKKALAKGFSLK